MTNSICPIPQFEGDFPCGNADGKLPVLDLKCWVEDKKVLYEYNSKPIASKLLIMNRSAMPEKVKRATLV